MRTYPAALIALVLTAACGGSKPKPTPVVSNQASATPSPAPVTPAPVAAKRPKPCTESTPACAMQLMSYYKDGMCECADRLDQECGNRLIDEMTKWAQAAAQSMDKNEKPSEADMDRMSKIGEAIGECTTRVMSIEDPSAGSAGSAAP